MNSAKNLIRAVNGVSFKVFSSEFISLVGESGSGKTMVAKCIAKIVSPESGSIMFEGKDISKLSGSKLKEYHCNVQIVYQDPYKSLNPRQDVFTTVSAPIRKLRGERGKEKLVTFVQDVLREVGLNPNGVMHRFPHQLSDG